MKILITSMKKLQLAMTTIKTTAATTTTTTHISILDNPYRCCDDEYYDPRATTVEIPASQVGLNVEEVIPVLPPLRRRPLRRPNRTRRNNEVHDRTVAAAAAAAIVTKVEVPNRVVRVRNPERVVVVVVKVRRRSLRSPRRNDRNGSNDLKVPKKERKDTGCTLIGQGCRLHPRQHRHRVLVQVRET